MDATTTRKYGGTGLGLALVKTLVEAHHGTVRVESKHVKLGLGHGTTFIISLPIQQPDGRGRSPRSEVGSAVGLSGSSR